MIGLLLTLLLPILLAFWNFVWKRRGLPPGPAPLPIIGNALTISCAADPYIPYQNWADQYGPVYTFWQGEQPIVAVSDYSLMHDMFVKDGDAYAGRMFMKNISEVTTVKGGVHGVTHTEGKNWREMRRFGLQAMRNMGVGKSGMERQFIEDIRAMLGRVERAIGEQEGESGHLNGPPQINLQKHIDRLVGSTINRLLFGFAFADDQLDQFYAMKRTLDNTSRLISSLRGFLLITAPWLRHFPWFAQKFKEFDEGGMEIFNYVDRQIEERMEKRKRRGRPEEPKDLLDHFLDKMDGEEEGGEEGSQQGQYNKENFRHLCFDLFLAGQETTSTTLRFLVLYLLLDQRAQTKMQRELDQIGGEEEQEGEGEGPAPIGLAHRPKLHYTNAVINEVQRMCNLLPVNLTHKTLRDVAIMDGKYRIKQGTAIIPQISTILYDEKVFPNADQFLPERFLDENGHLKRCDQMAPFGMGKRVCMGESLARAELFLFTANFFRHFSVFPVDPIRPPSATKQNAFVIKVAPYNCRLVARMPKQSGMKKFAGN